MTPMDRSLSEWIIRMFKETGGSLSMEEALHVLMEGSKEFIPYQSLAVMMLDDNTDEVYVKTSRKLSYSFVKKWRRNSQSLVISRVLLKHELVVLNDIAPGGGDYEAVKLEYDFSCACLAPVVSNQRTVGYVHCDRAGEGAFSGDESRAIHVLALFIGLLMEKFDLLYISRHLARIDEASKALKYNAFLDEYRRELARAKTFNAPLTLILFDIDNFPDYLGIHGIQGGHELLKTMHGLIREVVREMDLVGRFSADEFIVCMYGIDKDTAKQIADRISLVIEEKAGKESGTPVTISGACVTFDQPAHYDIPIEKMLTILGGGLLNTRVVGKSQIEIIQPPSD